MNEVEQALNSERRMSHERNDTKTQDLSKICSLFTISAYKFTLSIVYGPV